MSPDSPVRTILLATSNPGKLHEIQAEMADLPARWITLADLDDPPAPPEETGDTFAANAAEKSLYYARETGLWTVADDSGLEVDALGGAPGVHSARFAGPEQDDDANNAKLLADLADVADEQRTARFRCALALTDGQRVLAETAGAIQGRIAHAPAGENGFGYDPLFFVPDLGCTTAELSPARKNQVSHRGQAVRALHPLLEELLEA